MLAHSSISKGEGGGGGPGITNPSRINTYAKKRAAKTMLFARFGRVRDLFLSARTACPELCRGARPERSRGITRHFALTTATLLESTLPFLKDLFPRRISALQKRVGGGGSRLRPCSLPSTP